ncbi:MAG: T9SS type A sorting domain-containing protein, partial [Bacteroidota bacterium]
SLLEGKYTDSIPGQTDTDSLYFIVEAQNSSDSIAESEEYVIAYDNNTGFSSFDATSKSTDPEIYPNPTKEKVFIVFDQPVKISTLELYDLTGKLVQKEDLSNAVKQKASFKIKNVSRGTYILKTSTRENIHYNKILVK